MSSYYIFNPHDEETVKQIDKVFYYSNFDTVVSQRVHWDEDKRDGLYEIRINDKSITFLDNYFLFKLDDDKVSIGIFNDLENCSSAIIDDDYKWDYIIHKKLKSIKQD